MILACYVNGYWMLIQEKKFIFKYSGKRFYTVCGDIGCNRKLEVSFSYRITWESKRENF